MGDAPEYLLNTCAAIPRLIKFKVKIGDTPNAQALSDHGAKVRCGTLQRCQRGRSLLFAPNGADKDLGVTKVWRGGDAGDGYETEPWITERSTDIGTDLFSE